METLKEKSTYIESVIIAALLCLNFCLNHFFNTVVLDIYVVLGILNVIYLMLIRKQYGKGQKHLWVLLLMITALCLMDSLFSVLNKTF